MNFPEYIFIRIRTAIQTHELMPSDFFCNTAECPFYITIPIIHHTLLYSYILISQHTFFPCFISTSVWEFIYTMLFCFAFPSHMKCIATNAVSACRPPSTSQPNEDKVKKSALPTKNQLEPVSNKPNLQHLDSLYLYSCQTLKWFNSDSAICYVRVRDKTKKERKTERQKHMEIRTVKSRMLNPEIMSLWPYSL